MQSSVVAKDDNAASGPPPPLPQTTRLLVSSFPEPIAGALVFAGGAAVRIGSHEFRFMHATGLSHLDARTLTDVFLCAAHTDIVLDKLYVSPLAIPSDKF